MQGTEPPDFKTTRLYIILLMISVLFVYGAHVLVDRKEGRDKNAPAAIKAEVGR